MLNIVLYEPEIPSNTGNIGRSCVVAGAALHLIEPLGFSMDAKQLRRSGMAYWQSLEVHVYKDWADFIEQNELTGKDAAARLHFLTKKAKKTYCEATYHDGDFLVFGKESSGIPEDLLAQWAESCERIPMLKDSDALVNVDSWDSGEVRVHKALEQDISGNFIDPEDYRISALNLSNSVAIVMYEALRQLNFPGME